MKSTLYACSPPILNVAFQRIEASPVGYRLACGAFWSLAGSIIARGLGLISGIIVARILGKTGFGQLGMIQSTVGMFGVLAGFSLGITATKHVAEYKTFDPARAGRIIGLSSLVAWGSGSAFEAVALSWRDHVLRDEKFVRPIEPAKLVGNATKAQSVLGWKPSQNFRELIREMTLADSHATKLSP